MVHGLEHALWTPVSWTLISRSPASGQQALPYTSQLLLQAAVLALGSAVLCSPGHSGCSTVLSPQVKTWTPREPSSMRSAPSKVQSGGAWLSDLWLSASTHGDSQGQLSPW